MTEARHTGETSGVEKTPRDVLADRIEEWAGDHKVYNYADAILHALDDAGFEVKRKPVEQFKDEERGAFLLLSLYLPEEDEDYDAEAAADALVGTLNRGRRDAGKERIDVGLFPTPQWYTAGVHDVLMRARDLVREERGDG